MKIEKFLFGKLRETRKELIKSKEKLLDKNKILEEYAFIISHNIRRPLANILGLTGLFNVSEQNAQSSTEIMNKIKQSAEELDELINRSNTILNQQND